MHVELQLVSRIIQSGQLPYVIEWGIQEQDFRTTDGRGLFQHLVSYWKSVETSGAVPGPHCFKNLYPAFEFCDDPAMTTEALCVEVRKQRIIVETREAMVKANDAMEIDPITVLSNLLGELTATRTLGLKMHDDPLSKSVIDLRRRYELAESGVGTCALRWPWEPFNDATLGIQDDDYIVLYGRPKSKKSFVLGGMIASAYDQDKLALVYTKEMPTWQIHRRATTAIGRLPFDEVRLGKLSPQMRAMYYEVMDMIEQREQLTNGRHNVIAISGKDAPAGQDSISWLRGKVEKYKPDIVFIDGLYLMAADRKVGKDEERVKQISRATRQLVLDTKVPVVATMQANRAAAKNADAELDEIAYSDAIGQDATCAIRVINENNSPPTVVLKVAGSREFQLDGIRIGGAPYSDFEFKERLDAKELSRVIKGDQADATPTKGKGDGKHTPITRKPSNENQERKLMEEQLRTVG